MGLFMGGRSFRAFLPKRLRARRPEEMRMGSPQYGQLILDGDPVSGALEIEAGSLVWSSDGWKARRAGARFLARRPHYESRGVRR
jgi:hypothetical protein